MVAFYASLISIAVLGVSHIVLSLMSYFTIRKYLIRNDESMKQHIMDTSSLGEWMSILFILSNIFQNKYPLVDLFLYLPNVGIISEGDTGM